MLRSCCAACSVWHAHEVSRICAARTSIRTRDTLQHISKKNVIETRRARRHARSLATSGSCAIACRIASLRLAITSLPCVRNRFVIRAL
jgi:hypothetical protein